MTVYRPFLLTRRGELTAWENLTASSAAAIDPVLVVHPRDWNFDSGTYSKSLKEHLTPVPRRLFEAFGARQATIDVSLLDSDDPIDGSHPLDWLVTATESLGLGLASLVSPDSSISTISAVTDLHNRFGRGAAVRLSPENWTTINPGALPTLISRLGLSYEDLDLFLDVGTAFGPVIGAATRAELAALEAAYSFRAFVVGGAAFPETAGLPKGVSEFERSDWRLYESIQTDRSRLGQNPVQFLDYAILNPNSIDLGVDPRFMMISAMLRYTTEDRWLITKGDLYKGPAGKSLGGSALPPALTTLVAHPAWGTPTPALLDGWVAQVLAGTASPGGPEAWRMYGTNRHLEITLGQIARLGGT